MNRSTSPTTALSILGFCDYFAEPLVGGSERVTAEVFGRIGAEDGTSVTIVSAVGGSGTRATQVEGVEVVATRGVDLSKLVGAQVMLAPMLPLVAARVFRRLRPDVIHGSSIHFFGTVVAATIALVTRTPFVVTCHLSSIDALPARARLMTRMYERTVGRFVLARARNVIAVSLAVRDHLLDLGVAQSKIAVIENGVDVRLFAPGTEPGVDTDAIEVAVIGRLITNKGTIEVANSLRHVRSRVRVSFVGTGPLDRAVRDLAVTDPRLAVLGHRDDVAAILARTDIFVRYSTTEGRSLAVLEAMSAGCAVIVSDISANVELIEHERTGLVVRLGDTTALGDAIDRLAGDETLRLRLGIAARVEVERFGWDGVAARTRKVIADAADES